ncbi:hypothetical protein ABLN72_05010, partial [Mycobacterium tuberculosis]
VLRSVKRFRVFNLKHPQHFHCFRIYRETLSRFRAPLCRTTVFAFIVETLFAFFVRPLQPAAHRWPNP